MKALIETRGALFSYDRIFRYKLWRTWGRGRVMVRVLLNPSTANETKNDPTVERRRARAAREWRILEGEIARLQEQVWNPNFVAKAPPEVRARFEEYWQTALCRRELFQEIYSVGRNA